MIHWPMQKRPCNHRHVVPEGSCPPNNIPHELTDYPGYYTPLWNPGWFPEVFRDEVLFLRWLSSEFKEHANDWFVEMGIGEVIISSLSGTIEPFSLDFGAIADESFYPAEIVLQKRTEATFSVININPSWLFSPERHLVEMLSTCTTEELRQVVSKLGLDVYDRRVKQSLVQAISTHAKTLGASLSGLTEEGLTAVCTVMSPCDANTILERLNVRRKKIAFVFESHFGSNIATMLRMPDAPLPNISVLDNAVFDKLFGSPGRVRQEVALRRLGNAILQKSLSRIISLRLTRSENWDDGSDGAVSILDGVYQRCNILGAISRSSLRDTYLSWEPYAECLVDCPYEQYILYILRHEYGSNVIDALIDLKTRSHEEEKMFMSMRCSKRDRDIPGIRDTDVLDEVWPTVVGKETVQACLRDYLQRIKWVEPPVCAICSRSSSTLTYDSIQSNDEKLRELNLHVLAITDDRIREMAVQSGDTRHWVVDDLDNTLLDYRGIEMKDGGQVSVKICHECKSPLRRSKMPKYALANSLYRGKLPTEFSDITWVEEMICAKHLNTAFVTKLTRGFSGHFAHKLRGNTCAHEMNLMSTVRKLPRTPADVNDMISVVFVGSELPDNHLLKQPFHVRRRKVWRLLLWLKEHNVMYADIELDVDVMKEYPDSDILPGLRERIILHEVDDQQLQEIHDKETAGLDDHPSNALYADDASYEGMFFEKTGVSDADQTSIPGRVVVASAVRKLIPKGDNNKSGLRIHRGKTALPEYKNPGLIPGMYPTLFPYGIGGFEQTDRSIAVSFESQASYFMDLADRNFRYHRSFMFVVLNIIQRRRGHLHTSFTASRGSFQKIADAINGLDVDSVQKLADSIENEGFPKKLSDAEKNAMQMLRYVNTIASRVPGSAASKTLSRNEIRSYVGVMGVPQIFLTINPSPHHHPVFHLMYGDTSINLDDRFPSLVPSDERARRLAHDPVAAANFFDHSIRCIFECLFGWDFEKKQSTLRGGILGRLEGFYGTAEYTERGVLHGHFLLWLRGGMNPMEVHKKMKVDVSFRERFFRFFEDVTRHEFPDVELQPDFNFNTYKPATEMPPAPLTFTDTEKLEQLTEEWETMFETEVKMCGEALQRHRTCKAVCKKYGKDGKCRFRFPHDIVDVSMFDADSNSIILACRDATVNYYNPYILVYCRHNHDIRCILSGKSAKAAMFYITDYITKTSMKTGQMLSLMCKAVLSIPDTEDMTGKARAKTALHKCLAQFSRRQQIHAQQCVRYLKGFEDHISSHKPIPVLSNLVYNYIREHYAERLEANPHTTSEEKSLVTGDIVNEDVDEPADPASGLLDEEPEDDTEVMRDRLFSLEDSRDCVEGARVQLSVSGDGKLVYATQLHDYLFRDDRLRHLSFMDFVCMYKREKYQGKSRSNKRTKDRFSFREGHPLSKSHVIVQRYSIDPNAPLRIYSIPRVVGMSIPRPREGIAYWIFAFCHFVPFSNVHDPLASSETIESFMRSYQFKERDKVLLANWDVVYECEDARDADRIAAQERDMMESRKLHNHISEFDHDDDEGGYELGNESPASLVEKDVIAMNVVTKLQESGYLCALRREDALLKMDHDAEDIESGMEVNARDWKRWDREIKNQQALIESQRDNLLHEDDQAYADLSDETDVEMSYIDPLGIDKENLKEGPQSETKTDTKLDGMEQEKRAPYRVRSTSVECDTNKSLFSLDGLLENIASKHGLNEKQRIAFTIASKSWYKIHESRVDSSEDSPCAQDGYVPLRLLMTGPGGTGKSHSIRALKNFMENFQSGHRLRLLAPTGSAATLIDGMTCHKGLALKVKKKSDALRHVQRTSFNETYEMDMTVAKKEEVRRAWKNVDVVLVDEVSLLSLQDLSELDHALRMAKERPNEWFGGIIVIFSGDFCQYPPVGGTPLYSCVRLANKITARELKLRLGRLAWKTLNAVVEFEEQFRMKQDAPYSEAVTRLRRRRCTEEDVALFNSRVIKSRSTPKGVDMSVEDNSIATMIVSKNDLRENVNYRKAVTTCRGELAPVLIRCAAQDFIGSALAPEDSERKCRSYLLGLNTTSHTSDGALPGILPLYIGMPVILRVKNIAVDLKIANGSQGYVYGVETFVDAYGFTCAKAALVHFPNSPVQLSGLPKGVFPIKAISWSFKASIELIPGRPERHKIKRLQLPIQPGFCVTGHSAQGKTMDKVLCNLREGSWSAYVAASRARRRQDLYLLQPVGLKELNKPHPYDLLKELARHKALEHNTLISHGFKKGDPMAIPDPDDSNFSPSSSRYVGTSSTLIWDIMCVDSEVPTDGGEQNDKQELPKQPLYHSIIDETVVNTASQVNPEKHDLPHSAESDKIDSHTMHSNDPESDVLRKSFFEISPAYESSPLLRSGHSNEGTSLIKPDEIVSGVSSGPSVDLSVQKADDPNNKFFPSRHISTVGSVNDTLKKRSLCDVSRAEKSRRVEIQGFQGCTWSSENWSCAYDCVVIAVACSYLLASSEWRYQFRTCSRCADVISSKLEHLSTISWPWQDPVILNHARDEFRKYLSAIDSRQFPRYGRTLASVVDILDVLSRSTRDTCKIMQRDNASICVRAEDHRTRTKLMQELYYQGGDVGVSFNKRHDIQCWINGACTLSRSGIWADNHGAECGNPDSTPFIVMNPPALLYFSQPPSTGNSTLPCAVITLPTLNGLQRYTLRSIIYWGGNHFTARFVFATSVYQYDSQREGGRCLKEDQFTSNHLTDIDRMTLCSMEDRVAHVYLYARI